MRVTNAMLSNNMILGLNKNMNKLNTLYDQMNSLKKIQRPSDDPIILGRSLKLRLNVLETEQYKINVGEAKSWMEVSEGSISNTHAILNDIRQESAQAANGTLDHKDRQKIMTSIEQLKKQLIQESNANYAGRNVFAGYKTDQKVLFDKDQPGLKGEFEHTFKAGDLGAKDYKGVVTHREKDYYRVRAPYGGIQNGTIQIGDPLTNITIKKSVKSTDTPDQGPPIESFYHPGPGEAYVIEDTGEFILNKADYDAMGDNFKISYEKTGFKEGDPNPALFFEKEPPVPPATEAVYTKSKGTQSLEYEIGIGTRIDVNVAGKDLYNPFTLRDIDELVQVLGSYEAVEAGIKGQEDVNGGKPTRSPQETINLSKLFSNAIGKMDTALKSVSREQADLGSRMKRLDLTEKRLSDDEISYTDLLSRTEDVELERAYIDFNTQYAVYQSALQVTAKVVQPTLMDFLR